MLQRHHFVEGEQQQASQDNSSTLFSTTVDFSAVDAAWLFDRVQGQERILWEQPRQGFSLVAIGTAAQFTGSGKEGFSQVSTAWRRLLSRATIEASPSCPLPAPVSLGGFAFDPAGQSESAWTDYPDALLIIPRLLYLAYQDTSWLTVNVMVTPGCDARAAAETTLEAFRTLLATDETAPLEASPGPEVSLHDPISARCWQATVAAVVKDIQRQAVEKVVLARQIHLNARRSLHPGSIIRRLRVRYHDCTVFAFARGKHCFVGATPERLIRLDGQRVQATCLAGTTARGTTADEDQLLGEKLLADDKERHEHALVVRALRQTLEPICVSLNVPETPGLLRVSNVQHLYTPVAGVLQQDSDILELIARLHPTPALGGEPRQAALELIRTYEPFHRGWYAGPVGWIDGRGGGEFVVAVRSALLRGSEAWLYAGCGIVAGSDPEREYHESCLKLQPMLWALGAYGNNENT